MTPNLPLSLALFIPTKDHAEAEAAFVTAVDEILTSRIEAVKETMLRALVNNSTAFLASFELEDALAGQHEKDKPRTRILPGERGENHDQYVATFRVQYPNGENELRAIFDNYPPATTMTPAQHAEIKAHFGMGTRSLLLSPMLRELGCRENRSGRWITPILRIVANGSR